MNASGDDLQTIVDSIAEGVIIHRGEGILYANKPLAKLLRFNNVSELIGKLRVKDLVYPEDWAVVMRNTQGRLGGSEAPQRYRFRIVRSDGRVRWVECRAQLISWHGEPASLASVYEITDQVYAETELRRSEQKFQQLFQMSPCAMALARLDDGVYIDVNNACCKVLGYSRSELIGSSALELGLWPDVERRDELVFKLRARGKLESELIDMSCKDGTVVPMVVWLSRMDVGNESYLMSVAFDRREELSRLEELHSTRKQLEFLANHDELTGLKNRRSFDRDFIPAFKKARRRGSQASLLYLDLDHFKEVNDQFGHAVGDEVLLLLAKFISEALHGRDLACRIGGDEFLIWVDDGGEAAAIRVATRLLEKSARLRDIVTTLETQLSLSIGIAELSDDVKSAEELKDLADQALYRAKSKGKNGYSYPE